jgi:hypothetical protein
MSTQGTGARRRSKLSAALVALALTVAVFALATQANSITSTRIGPQVRPVPTHLAPSANLDLRASSRISAGCRRPKYGCQHRLRASSRISAGCRRPKYGCQQGGTTIAERP